VSYEIRFDSPRRVDEVFDTAVEHAMAISRVKAEVLRRNPAARVTVLRDGEPISDAELAEDVRSEEIRATMEETSTLPDSYRRARTENADIASGSDGQRHGAWKPRNPEDRYE